MSTTTITLPDPATTEAATHLDAYWRQLGFVPHPRGDGWIEVTGIHRRLAAGLRSIRTRGFFGRDFLAETPDDEGWLSLVWSSDRGTWGCRSWKVSTRVRIHQGRLETRETEVAVKSATSEKWTTFRGGPLDQVVGRRLLEVLAVLVLRDQDISLPEGFREDELTEEEVETYHDLHPSPVAAFIFSLPEGEGVVVLDDDDYGSGNLSFRGRAAPARVVKTVLAAWALGHMWPTLEEGPNWAPAPVVTESVASEPEVEVEPMPDWERELLGE